MSEISRNFPQDTRLKKREKKSRNSRVVYLVRYSTTVCSTSFSSFKRVTLQSRRRLDLCGHLRGKGRFEHQPRSAVHCTGQFKFKFRTAPVVYTSSTTLRANDLVGRLLDSVDAASQWCVNDISSPLLRSHSHCHTYDEPRGTPLTPRVQRTTVRTRAHSMCRVSSVQDEKNTHKRRMQFGVAWPSLVVVNSIHRQPQQHAENVRYLPATAY